METVKPCVTYGKEESLHGDLKEKGKEADQEQHGGEQLRAR